MQRESHSPIPWRSSSSVSRWLNLALLIACREAHCRLFQAFGTGGKGHIGGSQGFISRFLIGS
jgi:hypothetical protein